MFDIIRESYDLENGSMNSLIGRDIEYREGDQVRTGELINFSRLVAVDTKTKHREIFANHYDIKRDGEVYFVPPSDVIAKVVSPNIPPTED